MSELLAAGGAKLLDFGLGQIGDAINAKRARKFWKEQMEYNHPAQQMARLKEAGLNPNLVYGASSGGAAGNAPSAAQYKPAPRTQSYQQSAVNAMQVQMMKEQLNTQREITKQQKIKTEKDYLIHDFMKGPAGDIRRVTRDTQGDPITFDHDYGLSLYNQQVRDQMHFTQERLIDQGISNIVNEKYSPQQALRNVGLTTAKTKSEKLRAELLSNEAEIIRALEDGIAKFGADSDFVRMIMRGFQLLVLNKKK